MTGHTVIRCHRVVGKRLQSGGFGMGMKAKKILIGLENNEMIPSEAAIEETRS